MSAELGHFALVTALLAAGGALVAGVAALRFGSAGALRVARGLLFLFSALMVLASVVLEAAFMDNDFRIRYVTEYSEKALPAVYKVTAFWAGQPGSLLLWGLILGIVAAAYLYQNRRRSETSHGVSLVALGVLGVFITGLLVFAADADPFATLSVAPDDGMGLNPQLQTFGMIAHPPMLFVGYVGFAIPFIIMLETLVAGRRDDRWISTTRPWLLVAWLFLSAGIVLGAQWAYVELSYGGYWKWDPVENASLLPWLTGTALLHSVMVQRQRGSFRRWNVFLIAMSFILCIFGMYLMRSDVAQSVHSFHKSSIGTTFLALLIALLVVSSGLIIWRRKDLKSDQRIEALLGKEGVFAAINILLVVMTLIILVGTIFPLISRNLWGQEITVKENFYNTVVSPMGLALLALMAIGPMLGYGKEAAARLPRRMVLPGIVAGAAAVGAFAIMHRMGLWQAHPITFHWRDSGPECDLANIWALACVVIVAFGLAAIIEDLIRATLLRARDQNESPILAVVRLFDYGHRRYGGQLVHVGMMMILAGVIGSSLFGQRHLVEVTQGQDVAVGSYSLRLNGIKNVDHDNFVGVVADVWLTDRAGRAMNLHPEVRFFKNERWREQHQSEIALSTTPVRDVYMTLPGYDADTEPATATIEILVNPLVLWIWIGGGVIVLGGILALVPPLLPSSRLAAASASNREPALPRSSAGSPTTSPANGSSRQTGRAKNGNGKSQKDGKTASFRPQTEN